MGIAVIAALAIGFILGLKKGSDEGSEQLLKICDRLCLTQEEIERILDY